MALYLILHSESMQVFLSDSCLHLALTDYVDPGQIAYLGIFAFRGRKRARGRLGYAAGARSAHSDAARFSEGEEIEAGALAGTSTSGDRARA
jgi:hypothetical protein